MMHTAPCPESLGLRKEEENRQAASTFPLALELGKPADEPLVGKRFPPYKFPTTHLLLDVFIHSPDEVQTVIADRVKNLVYATNDGL